MPPLRNYYEVLGVDPACSFDELRSAYRRLARLYHPDVASRPSAVSAVAGGGSPRSSAVTMAEVNEAWKVLSDLSQRKHYDSTLAVATASQTTSRTRFSSGSSSPPGSGQRRQMWFAGIQAQIARLSRQAGRSATQTLLIRSPRAARADYDLLVEDLVVALSSDAEHRIRAARAAGAAPLDLGVGATLVGIRSLADRLRRESTLGLTTEQLMAAELLDRMWDVLSHELPHSLSEALGGNPHVAQALHRRSS